MNNKIYLHHVKVHNLKSVDLMIEPNTLTVFTGVSGSGKSSMAFDTLYVEGQRRYIQSLSTFARRQMGEMAKPDFEFASGISPTISIEQKTAGRNPRSTVGTMTEIYDYLRVLYARVGVPHCPVSGEAVMPQSKERIIKTVESLPEGTKIILLSPYARAKKAEFKEDFQDLLRKGFTRIRLDCEIVNLGDEMTLDGTVAHDVDIVIDRLVVQPSQYSRIAESLTQALSLGNGVCSVLRPDTDEEILFSMHAYSQKSGLSYGPLEPHDFSFNSPSGMCTHCQGMGVAYDFNLDLIIDPERSIAEDCISVGSSYQTVHFGNIFDNLADLYGFSVQTPWKKLSEKAKKVILYGTEKKWTRMHFINKNTGSSWVDNVQWKGVLHEARTRYSEAKSELYRKKIEKLMVLQSCQECKGSRLRPYPSAAEFLGKKIQDLTSMTIGECYDFFHNCSLKPQEKLIADELLKEITSRLSFLKDVGLHYLTLDRTAPTLSGGEAQRVRLASQIGCGLVGITYILDEPSIGLHPIDNRKLIETLTHLRDMGNTVIVVEHDEDTICAADKIVDFGPGAGTRGGEVVVNGSLLDLLTDKKSITGQYLAGKLTIPIPKKRRKAKKEAIEISGASHHNLKNINVRIPLGVFIAVTGVSGSGKSSLITDTLFPALSNALHKGEHTVGAHREIRGIKAIDKVIAIDQSPIGRNPRSNPATYIKLFDEIRDLFAKLPESAARGYLPGRFSFNVREGSCPHCGGMGMIKLDMDFMEDSWITCPECNGKRFDPDTLSVFYKGKNIYEILEMEVEEALTFFENIPSIKHKLETLKKVGMEYIKLGQSSTTLSGGEAQRVKLAKELVRPSTGNTLYILDEPTTGLHFHDIKHLLEILQTFVDKGNTVLVIEHNMDVVKTADWIIDLGPEGGQGGGQVIATGTPEQIAKKATATGHELEKLLHIDYRARLELAKEKQKWEKSEAKSFSTPIIDKISVQDAGQNNLKSVSAEIPREKMTICTGPSGSGKSSFAFETIYAEGQRRYIESLSPYARQFVHQMPKPKVGRVEGLSPAIAIEQKATAGNPRSTVGTMTEIYDYLRILFARIGIPHDPDTGEVIQAISKQYVVEKILEYPEGEKVQILAPIQFKKSDSFADLIARFKRQGFVRIRLNDIFYDLDENEAIPFDRKRKNELALVIDRLKINSTIEHRLYEAIDHASTFGNRQVIVMRESGDVFFNLAFAAASTGKSYNEITPHTFSFNSTEGMCPDCLGLGYQYGANLIARREFMKMTPLTIFRFFCGKYIKQDLLKLYELFLKSEKINSFLPLDELPRKQLLTIFNGLPEEKWIGTNQGFQFRWPGFHAILAKIGKHAITEIRDETTPLLNEQQCPSCLGTRLNPLARHVTINEMRIGTLCNLSITHCLEFIKTLANQVSHNKQLSEIHQHLITSLQFLCDVGLEYIALERKAPTLSGGEAQRIRLARQLGTGLTGVLYVLDEPTIGLHPQDNERLNQALNQLKALGNTLLLVEHDPLTLRHADHILDFGPASGSHGGHIVAQGTYEQIMHDTQSLTGDYLSGRKSIMAPRRTRTPTGETFSISRAKLHNLKDLNIEFPVGIMTCLTGVSGSGKSTLLNDILLPALEQGIERQDKITFPYATVEGISHFDQVICIDQNPIGLTVRSDVCTYANVLTPIREFFAQLPEAKIRGLEPKHFSYNHRKGMCTACWGLGYKRIYMHFLPEVRVTCEDCGGMRLNPVSLEVAYKGKNLGEWLESTVDEAYPFFENIPRIKRILETLREVGLGYLKLGQEIQTLSGGEAQRIKLSRELAKRTRGKTIYLLDEPTTGLHSDDIAKLLHVLHKLVDKGHTMIIIEHHSDVVRNADWIVDLGPGAGERGGRVVYSGTPANIKSCRDSATGRYL